MHVLVHMVKVKFCDTIYIKGPETAPIWRPKCWMHLGGERSGFGEPAHSLIGFSPLNWFTARELFNGADSHLLMACKHTESAASAAALFADTKGPAFGDPRTGFKKLC